MELLSGYGLFLAKAVTVVVVIAVVVMLIVNATQHKRQRRELQVINLNDQYKEVKEDLSLTLLDEHQQKFWHEAQEKKQKLEAKATKAKTKLGNDTSPDKPRVRVLDSKGSTDTHEVSTLRGEVTAVLVVARPQDQVVVRLESPGDAVHGYGLTASQLQRLRDRQIPLIVMVDKVVVSGGYTMAYVADKIVLVPPAIVGSISVVAQIPNFSRFLKGKDIDIELYTAGQYKRTLTLLGENTEEGRQKFHENLNETHHLPKDFVHHMRPTLDIEQVATDKHWFGQQALANGLVDKINASDEMILGPMEGHEMLNVRYLQRRKLIDRFISSAAESADRLLVR